MGRSMRTTSKFSMALNTEEWAWRSVLFVCGSCDTWSTLRRRVTMATKMEKVSFLGGCMSLGQKNRVFCWSTERRNSETKLIFFTSSRPQRKFTKANKLESILKCK